MTWSARDQLRKVVLIARTGGDPDDDELYDYAADNKRIRKTTNRLVSGNVEKTETIYLDGCELRRVTQITPTPTSTVILERWSSHAELEDGRVATLYRWVTDTLERETDDTSVVKTHFHLATNIGSVALELDDAGAVLSYEEYFPYGGTAFVAGESAVDVGLRTLRFVGKDQDDSTGFYVFQFRYYAPFIGNWVSADPAGEVDGPNLYAYCHNNPITGTDPLELYDPGWFDVHFDPESGLSVSVNTSMLSVHASVRGSGTVAAHVESSLGSLDAQVSTERAHIEAQVSGRSARADADSSGVTASVEAPEVRAHVEVSRRRGIEADIATADASVSIHIQDPSSELQRAAGSEDPDVRLAARVTLETIEQAEAVRQQVQPLAEDAWNDFVRGLAGESSGTRPESIPETTGRLLRENEFAQMVVGAAMGGLVGFTPGGFLFSLGLQGSGTADRLPRTFMMFYGQGEGMAGVAQMAVGLLSGVGGGTAAGGGAAATSTGAGAPAGAPAMALGTATVAVSTATVAEGLIDVGVGGLITMSAMSRSPDAEPPPPPERGAAAESAGTPTSEEAAHGPSTSAGATGTRPADASATPPRVAPGGGGGGEGSGGGGSGGGEGSGSGGGGGTGYRGCVDLSSEGSPPTRVTVREGSALDRGPSAPDDRPIYQAPRPQQPPLTASQLAVARSLSMNAASPTTQQVLRNLGETVESFVGRYRLGSIRSVLPTEVLDMTVEEALRYSSTVRKLLNRVA